MKKRYISIIIVSSIILIVVGGFFIWASISYKPMDDALISLNSTDDVDVIIDDFITFSPTQETPTKGLIFYPGGKVEPESYAPLMMNIAENGFLVIIVPMPFNLAFFSPNKATEVIADYPSIQNWTIAGHSLGGAMAARYVYNNPSVIDGLIIYASYPADSDDMSSYDLQTLVIYGSEDTGLNVTIIDKLALLPPSTTVVEIVGGNHAYFGWYGEQSGDGIATITRTEQQEIILNETVSFLTLL